MSVRRVLVLQTCRMGDILQTTPMLRGLRRQHPDAELTLVLVDQFAGTPIPSHLYDRCVPFPLAALRREVGPETDWHAALDRLRAFVREVGTQPFDLSINLAQTYLSGLLMALIPATERRGAVVRPNRTHAPLGAPWQYLWASATARALACFNLVDLFAWTAGVPRDEEGLELAVPPEAEARAAAWLAGQGIAERPLIAIQLGASEEAKRWPAECFAATAALLGESAGEVVLVGTAGERPLAERFQAVASRKAHLAVGVTSLTELAALLRRCRLLMTNDTGTMHVAAAVGTRVMDISTGPVFVHETGPYGLDHVVIEPEMPCFPCAAGATCHHHACRERLAPASAAAIARFALGEAQAPRFDGGRILTARRKPSGRLEYWPLDASRVTLHDVVRRASAEVWEEDIGVPARGVAAGGAEDGRDTPGGWGALCGDAGAHVIRALETLAREGREAAALAGRLPSETGAGRRKNAADLQARLDGLRRLADVEAACHPIVSYLLIQLDAIVAADIKGLASVQRAACAGAAGRAARIAARLEAWRLTEPESRFTPPAV